MKNSLVLSTSRWFWLAQGILAAILSTVVGARDPEQVNTMAKQAGEVSLISLTKKFFYY